MSVDKAGRRFEFLDSVVEVNGESIKFRHNGFSITYRSHVNSTEASCTEWSVHKKDVSFIQLNIWLTTNLIPVNLNILEVRIHCGRLDRGMANVLQRKCS